MAFGRFHPSTSSTLVAARLGSLPELFVVFGSAVWASVVAAYSRSSAAPTAPLPNNNLLPGNTAVAAGRLLQKIGARLPAFFFPFLLPLAVRDAWRHIRRRRRRAQADVTRNVERLVAEAAALSAQPLTGALLEAFREKIAEALRAQVVPPGLRPNAPSAHRAVELLRLRVEAFRQHAAAARPPANGAPPSSSAADEEAAAADSVVCKVCWDRPTDAMLVPCGHLAACTECLNKMLNDQGHVLLGHALRCPLCNGPVADVLKAYT